MLRKAIGAFKDQASISLAKVAGSVAPDLDVAILKATSHDELPIEEKYVQQILHHTSFSRAYSASCVAALVRRMNKTRNWIVALKTLMLSHRLLRDGDLGLEQELMMAGRRGLTGSDFRDESDPNAWDFSAFVRTYGLYLDERLEFSIGSLGPRTKPERRSGYSDSRSDYEGGGYYQDDYGSRRDSYEDRSRREESQQGSKIKQVKDMKADDLLEKFASFQRLLERVLACRPAGAARGNRLVQIALYPIVRESFLLHSDIRDGLAILLDAFFDMEQRDSVKVFDIYSRSAKQVDELISFYGYCKTLGVCRNTEIPTVEKISEELLETMEDFLRNRSGSSRGKRSKSPEPRPRSPPRDSEELAEEASYEINGMKALPAPPVPEAPITEMKPAPIVKEERNGNLLDLGEPPISSEEHGEKLALALFSGTETTSAAPKWETFSGAAGGPAMAETSAKSGWELALVETTSEISKPNNNSLAGGFDRLLLDSMYDQAVDRHNLAAATAPSGSASSVALPGRPQSSFLALPAPPHAMEGVTSQDPFAASINVPPPAYVQMSDVQHKQQLLVQEQQLWLQYQRDGMQGYHGLMKLPTNPFAAYFQPNAYPVPYYGNTSYYR